MTFTLIGAAAIPGWYIKKLARATGPLAQRFHGLNRPVFPGFILSTIHPIVTTVNASITLAATNKTPTSSARIPNTFV